MQEQAASSVSMTRFISYAQNYEDVMLWRALREISRGFYVDIGAQSPDSDSVTKAFSLRGWRGINVEPHPVFHDRLRQARPEDVNLGVAVGERAGRLTMNLVGESGLSTADTHLARKHEAAGYEIREYEVPMCTLDEVWRDHVPTGQPVHFLKVDVEGFEHAVLAGNNWERNRPWIVLVEAMLPNEQVECHEVWEPILLDARYMFAYADGLNRFYVAREREGLAAALTYPPNVFDNFITVQLEQAHERLTTVELEQAHERLGDVELQLGALGRQVAQMDRSLNESHRRIEQAEANAIDARARALAVQEQLDQEREALHVQIHERTRQVQLLAHRAEAAERAREAVMGSLWWRVSAPLHRVLSTPSPASRQGRRLLKAAWWAVTPWKMPARLESRRVRAEASKAAAAAELPLLNLYPHTRPAHPAEPPIDELPREVRDRDTAARWIIALLRSHPDLRARFPSALSDPDGSGFTAWVEGDGGETFGLSPESRSLVLMTLRADFSSRVRDFLQSRPDVLAHFPGGLQPDAQDGLYRWFMQFGCAEGGITREEVLWLLMMSAESAAQAQGESAVAGAGPVQSNKPRLALDTYVLAQNIKTGVYRVCDELYPRLARSSRVASRVLVREADSAKTSALQRKIAAPLYGAPHASPGDDADLLLSPFGVTPANWRGDPRVLHAHIVYDLIGIKHPEYFSTEGASEVKRIMDSLDRTTVVFAISEFTKRDLLEYRPDLQSEQVTVIPLAAGPQFRPCDDAPAKARVRAKYGIPPGVPFVLSLATLEVRKNLDHVVQAVAQFLEQHPESDLHLVLSGMSGWKLERLRQALSAATRWRQRIVLTGFVEDEDLAALYSDALCFVYLSRYEGFGLPPLEAMACGTPVISSNNSSLPEVVGDAGILVDAGDVRGVAEALDAICHSPETRAALARASLERASIFNWDRCADIVLDTLIAAEKRRRAQDC